MSSGPDPKPLPRKVIGGVARRALGRLGYGVVRLDPPPPDHDTYDTTHHDHRGFLPDGAADHLRRDNPRLRELHERYDALDWPVSVRSRWGEVLSVAWLNLAYFRGDNPYIWHYRESDRVTELKYFVLLGYEAALDEHQLIERLGEDGAFGAFTFEYPDRPVVGRDLLDSVNELLFLEEELGILSSDGLRVLDIGAGYGRMAHRVSQAVPGLARYTCLDAIPESTFLCEYYTRFRGLEHVEVVELPDVPDLPVGGYDLAFNIHSFSECPLVAIEWWMQQLARLEVPTFFLVPNEPEGFLSTEPDKTRLDYLGVIERHGYRLTVDRPMYEDRAVRELLEVPDRFCLFTRAR